MPPPLVSKVKATLEMVGLLRSPAVAATYEKLGIAYDGAKRRTQKWAKAEGFRVIYASNPTPEHAAFIADGAADIGHFSIWMEVFSSFPEMRRELIRAFKADPNCFDSENQPIAKGRL